MMQLGCKVFGKEDFLLVKERRLSVGASTREKKDKRYLILKSIIKIGL